MKSAVLIVGFMTGLAALAGSTYLVMRESPSPDRALALADSAPSSEHPVPVQAVPAQAHGLQRTVTRPGSIRSYEYAHLYAKVSGFLRNQKVDIGSEVHQGEVLAEIYAPELHADVQKREAELEKAKSAIDLKQAGIAAAQAQLREAKAHLEEVQANLQSATATRKLRQQEYERYKRLAAGGSVEQELVDEKEAARQAAVAAEQSARKAITTAQEKIGTTEAGVKQAQAELADARAQVNVAQANLENARVFQQYTQITAPYDGVVTARNFHDGDFIRDPEHGGEQPLFIVNRTDLMRIIVQVPDQAVAFIHSGDPASISVDALGGRTFHGKIQRIAHSEGTTSRTMRVEFDLPNKDHALEDGMYGSVTLDLGREEGLSIPSSCLLGEETDKQRFVYVIHDGRAHRIAVRVASDNGVRAVVTSPKLRPGDLVVQTHGPGLHDGAPVEGTQHKQVSSK